MCFAWAIPTSYIYLDPASIFMAAKSNVEQTSRLSNIWT